MKIFLPLLVFLLLSCTESGLSDHDKMTIEGYLISHNSSASLAYQVAYTEEETRLKIEVINMADTTKEKLISWGLKRFRNNWNDPYEITKDSTVTLEKYLDYCKANGYDATTYYKYIDEKK